MHHSYKMPVFMTGPEVACWASIVFVLNLNAFNLCMISGSLSALVLHLV